ncbi:uncharacterized protein RHO25_013159 [Cercospora beticola]|uniref:Uncharacterized protein n=2 Tax=Cercospora beticola TaxID=122368 RepID=A0ABZ0P9J0_CERBT|nr:hypothetical protein RHO25_013159 [Cercospora beticola]
MGNNISEVNHASPRHVYALRVKGFCHAQCKLSTNDFEAFHWQAWLSQSDHVLALKEGHAISFYPGFLRIDQSDAAPMSLWAKVDRKNFENDLTSLVAHGKYQDHSLLAEVDRPRRVEGAQIETALSEEDERQLADDIAFLTCVSQGRDGVTAAAVQQFPNKPFLRATVSANAGIPEATKTAVQRLFAHLEEWSRGKSTRKDTLSKVQTTLVTLHRDRIFDRLGIVKKAGTIGCGIEKSVEMILSQAMSTGSHDEEQLGFHRRLKKFQQALQQIMASQVGDEERKDFIRLLRCANKLMYFQDLISEHFGVDWMRQLRALANYHRIFHYLMTLATRAKALQYFLSYLNYRVSKFGAVIMVILRAI